ncbi:hypothetical protein ACIBCT_38745 [Streptosporangium sp. NPDC050855]|uniref:hypothetical protein n=1 Tax=Streptosporangium sp. NPDC050855 TaxID=3366194 RepID=UPI0037AC87A8
MNLALAFDELLHRPDIADIVKDVQTRIHAAGHGWILDQADAATRDTNSVLTAAAAAAGSNALHLNLVDHPDWVRLGLLDTLARWAAGQASTCMHSPNVMRPQPVLAAAWKPGLVVCAACAHLLQLPKGSARDRTCDACGVVVPSSGAIWSTAASHGGFVYQVGVCEPCRYWPVPADA